jgi:branched-chain amino acid transport system ATP-binding protein
MLEVENLDLAYGDSRALNGVSLTVAAGTITSVVGGNGAGKTSLIRACAGMVPTRGGKIRFDGTDITGWEPHRICNLGLGQVAEARQIFPSMSVLDNLTLGAALPRARKSAKATLDRVLSLFPRLSERTKQRAGTLSGGEQQMLAIGRCLMGLPRLIMFDEPSLGLAPAVVKEMFAIIEGLHQDGMTVLLVEQNVVHSLKIAQAAILLENGAVAMSGTGAELLADDRVRQAYLGL